MSEPLGLNPVRASRRQVLTLALLTGLAILAFGVVSAIARIVQMQQQTYATRWSSRGEAALHMNQFPAAINDFRAALRYDRDNFALQLNLAQALIAEHRFDEADAYLVNLLDRQPENGMVNLELARIAAMKNDSNRAMRYYHNAVYAIWPGEDLKASRNTRIELIDYLLQHQAYAQAQAELLALSANIAENSPEQEKIGELYQRAQDNQHALASFRLALRVNKDDHSALAGAGIAAFQQGYYPAAENYLHHAVEVDPDDQQSAAWLRKTESVLEIDPYRQQLTAAQRAHAAIMAFDIAGDRLKSCTGMATPASGQMQVLLQNWNKLKPQMNENGLRKDPDLINAAMDIAGKIETQASSVCGPGNEADAALLLIASQHEEN